MDLSFFSFSLSLVACCDCSQQEFSRDRRMYGMGIRRKGSKKHHQRSNSTNGARSLSKLSSSDQNLTKTSSNLAMRGRSRSQLSLGRAPSMTSVMEEPPRKSISTTGEGNFLRKCLRGEGEAMRGRERWGKYAGWLLLLMVFLYM